jgi:hypothetical protein
VEDLRGDFEYALFGFFRVQNINLPTDR